MQFRLTIPGILLLLLFASCSTARKTVHKKDFTLEKNLAFGDHKKQKLDAVILDSSDQNDPVIMLIHGGAWIRGDKKMLGSVQKMLAKHGYNSVNINYRLVNKKRNICEQLDDIHLARTFTDSIFGHRPLVLLGESAGGHLSYLYGYENAHNVEGIISLSGPASITGNDYNKTFKKVFAKKLLTKVTGSKADSSIIPMGFHIMSPAERIANVPTLLIHGHLDYLVSIKQAYAMQEALQQNNVEHKLVAIKLAGHVGRLNPVFRNKIIYPEILSFLEKR